MEWWLSDVSDFENYDIGDYYVTGKLIKKKLMLLRFRNKYNKKVFETEINLTKIKSKKSTTREKNYKIKQSKIKAGKTVFEKKYNISSLTNDKKYALIKNILFDRIPYDVDFLFDCFNLYKDYDYEIFNFSENNVPDNLFNYFIKEDKDEITIMFEYSYKYTFIVENLYEENKKSLLKFETIVTENFPITIKNII
jgi:hypothetical protein